MDYQNKDNFTDDYFKRELLNLLFRISNDLREIDDSLGSPNSPIAKTSKELSNISDDIRFISDILDNNE